MMKLFVEQPLALPGSPKYPKNVQEPGKYSNKSLKVTFILLVLIFKEICL